MTIAGRKVRILRLQGPTHVSGLGSVPTVVDLSQNSEKFKGATITHVAGGVVLFAKNVETFIPDANVISTELYPVEAAPKK